MAGIRREAGGPLSLRLSWNPGQGMVKAAENKRTPSEIQHLTSPGSWRMRRSLRNMPEKKDSTSQQGNRFSGLKTDGSSAPRQRAE